MTLAQLTGAPLLMGIAYRAADYRHQVLEISAPVPVDGDIKTVFERCAAEVSAAIRRSPASWAFWPDAGDLAAAYGAHPAAAGRVTSRGRETMGSTTSALDDLDLTIWHLPYEKRFGFRWAFSDLVRGRIPGGSSRTTCRTWPG